MSIVEGAVDMAHSDSPEFGILNVGLDTELGTGESIRGSIEVSLGNGPTFSYPFDTTIDGGGDWDLNFQIQDVPLPRGIGKPVSVAVAVDHPFSDGADTSLGTMTAGQIPGWMFVEGASVSLSEAGGGELEVVVDGEMAANVSQELELSFVVSEMGGEEYEVTAKAEPRGGTFEAPMTIPQPDTDKEVTVTGAITSPFESQSTYPHSPHQPPIVLPGAGNGGEPDPPDTDVNVSISPESPGPGRVIAQMVLSNPSYIPEVGELVWWVEDESGSELFRDSIPAPAPPGTVTFPADITGLPAGDLTMCAEFRPN